MARTSKIKIINILLSSLDGKIATQEFESTHERHALNFTNKSDFFHMQKLVAQCDAVIIGAKSIECEKGAFRVAHWRKNHMEPHWFVFTKTGRVNAHHDFWQQNDIPKSIFHYKTVSQLKEFLSSLQKQRIKKIALLGGGQLNGLFWSENLIDELHLTLSPFIVGKAAAPQLVSFHNAIYARLKLLKFQKKRQFFVFAL